METHDTPLWALTVPELYVPVRVLTCCLIRSLTKAWHVAVMCDRCLLTTRNLGRKSVQDMRTALAQHGFPPGVGKCGWRTYLPEEHRQEGECERNLAVCRRLLEEGKW